MTPQDITTARKHMTAGNLNAREVAKMHGVSERSLWRSLRWAADLARARARVPPYCVLSYETVAHCEAAGEEIKARANAKRSWIDYPLHRLRETSSLAYEVIEVLISPETLWRLQSRRI